MILWLRYKIIPKLTTPNRRPKLIQRINNDNIQPIDMTTQITEPATILEASSKKHNSIYSFARDSCNSCSIHSMTFSPRLCPTLEKPKATISIES